MAKIIILEGPDGGGKTTLANYLDVKWGYRYVHCRVPKLGESVFWTYAKIILKALRSKRPTVIDRCYLGEAVYGEVMRDGSQLSEEGLCLLHLLCFDNGVLELTCLPPFEVALRNWAMKKSDYVKTREQYTKIYDAYASYTCFQKYDYTVIEDVQWLQKRLEDNNAVR